MHLNHFRKFYKVDIFIFYMSYNKPSQLALDKKNKKEKELRMTLNTIESLFVYEGEELDFLKSSNLPAFNIEDQTTWKSYSEGVNPNLIGQIHFMKEESDDLHPVFHLCFNPQDRRLRKGDLKAIIKAMEYMEDFKEKKSSKQK